MTIGTFVVAALLLLVVIAIVRNLLRGAKQGKSIDCAYCSSLHDCSHATSGGAHTSGGCGCSAQMLDVLQQMSDSKKNEPSTHT